MKMQLGPLVSQLSGKAGGAVASRNRYGPYIRRRAHPTVSTTSYAMLAKARFAVASQAWQSLTDAKQEAWRVWAGNNPIVDRLGERRVLQGNAAYVEINARRLAFSDAQLDLPPVGDTPSPLTALSLHGDIGAGKFDVVFAATPLAASHKLVCRAAVVTEGDTTYIKNKLKLVGLSSAAQASPWDWESDFVLRMGTLQVGELVFCEAQVYDGATGMISLPMQAKIRVTTTP